VGAREKKTKKWKKERYVRIARRGGRECETPSITVPDKVGPRVEQKYTYTLSTLSTHTQTTLSTHTLTTHTNHTHTLSIHTH